MTDWDDAFDNVGHVPDAPRYFERWQVRASDFRRSAHNELNLSYGVGERQKLDIFWPDCDPSGLVVFVHGGYWTKLDRTFFSDLAAGPIAHGFVVAVPSYTLAPQARVSAITLEIAQAIAFAATRVTGQIRLAGHSAGGHLVTRMISDKALLSKSIQGRIAKTLSISGLHDLRNLCKTKLNASLRLSAKEAKMESPCLAEPSLNSKVTCWVGGDERPEFIRQTHLLNFNWQKSCQINSVVEPGRHHFNVIDGLKNPDSPLTRSLLEL